VALCDAHAVSFSLNGGGHRPAQQQSQMDDRTLAALARCGALAAAGNGSVAAGVRSPPRVPAPPARAPPGRPTAPPPPPPPTLPPNGISMRRGWAARDARAEHAD